MVDADSRTYQGNCHCGAIKFSVVLPPLETTPLHSCGCSICAKKGYLFVFPPKSAITVTKGAGTDGLGASVLTDYAFNSKQLAHRFCGRCGTPFGIVRYDGEGVVALNVRMFMDIDVWSFAVKEDPGPVTPIAYTVPVCPALKDFAAQPLEPGEKIYTGSCHCGAVTFALKSPWLLEDKGPEDVENNQAAQCDCSSCIRHAGIYAYPRPRSRVAIAVSPSDALATYFSPVGKGFGGAQFCRLCGCQLFQHLVGPPAERVAAAPPAVQERIRAKLDCKPVHLRALDIALGLTGEDKAEWARVLAAAKRERGSLEGPAYVVPE